MIECAHDELSLYALALVELIEAAVRSKRPWLAATALERLGERTRASATEWALGIEARSHALLTDGPSAEPLYEEAVERLAHGRLAPHLARARLVYGEWLRRENRRVDAREQLRDAHDTFSRIGAEAFAERARRELSATGEAVRKHTLDTSEVLTAQEAQVAHLARDGLSNPEIGAQLFISPRTVHCWLVRVGPWTPRTGLQTRRGPGRGPLGLPGPRRPRRLGRGDRRLPGPHRAHPVYPLARHQLPRPGPPRGPPGPEQPATSRAGHAGGDKGRAPGSSRGPR
jgi:hypothetical protein